MTLHQFLNVMKQRLRENRHKGGWHEEPNAYLLQRAREELTELSKLLRRGESRKSRLIPIDAKAVAREAADVANFCYMIADNIERD